MKVIERDDLPRKAHTGDVKRWRMYGRLKFEKGDTMHRCADHHATPAPVNKIVTAYYACSAKGKPRGPWIFIHLNISYYVPVEEEK